MLINNNNGDNNNYNYNHNNNNIININNNNSKYEKELRFKCCSCMLYAAFKWCKQNASYIHLHSMSQVFVVQ